MTHPVKQQFGICEHYAGHLETLNVRSREQSQITVGQDIIKEKIYDQQIN
jgi:hypothetical protein